MANLGYADRFSNLARLEPALLRFIDTMFGSSNKWLAIARTIIVGMLALLGSEWWFSIVDYLLPRILCHWGIAVSNEGPGWIFKLPFFALLGALALFCIVKGTKGNRPRSCLAINPDPNYPWHFQIPEPEKLKPNGHFFVRLKMDFRTAGQEVTLEDFEMHYVDKKDRQCACAHQKTKEISLVSGEPAVDLTKKYQLDKNLITIGADERVSLFFEYKCYPPKMKDFPFDCEGGEIVFVIWYRTPGSNNRFMRQLNYEVDVSEIKRKLRWGNLKALFTSNPVFHWQTGD